MFGVHVVATTSYITPEFKDVVERGFGIRIALSSDEQTSTILVGDKSASLLSSLGTAVYNESYGNPSANILFQVAYPNKDETIDLLKQLQTIDRP